MAKSRIRQLGEQLENISVSRMGRITAGVEKGGTLGRGELTATSSPLSAEGNAG